MALVLSGRPKEAIEEFDAAERLSPHDPFLWNFAMWRAWSRISLEDFARAVEDASNATRQPKAPFPTWGTLASALGHVGRIEEARAALDKALALEPRFSSPQFFEEIWPNSDPVFFARFYAGLRKIDPQIADPQTILAARSRGRVGPTAV